MDYQRKYGNNIYIIDDKYSCHKALVVYHMKLRDLLKDLPPQCTGQFRFK